MNAEAISPDLSPMIRETIRKIEIGAMIEKIITVPRETSTGSEESDENAAERTKYPWKYGYATVHPLYSDDMTPVRRMFPVILKYSPSSIPQNTCWKKGSALRKRVRRIIAIRANVVLLFTAAYRGQSN